MAERSSRARTGRIRLEAGRVTLELDPEHGGRVTALALDGRNVLTGPELHPTCYGSTLWTSPQSAWGWPPPPEIDALPYRASRDGAAIVLHGEPSHALGIAVQKRFELDPSGAVQIEYALHNHAEARVVVAAWEVTRVFRRGVSCFAAGGDIASHAPFAAVPCSQALGLRWVDHARPLASDAKLYAESPAGWLAHAAEDWLFVKRFEHRPELAPAPGEAPIELFESADPPYLELEQQAPLCRLEAGETSRWRVEWRLLALPPDVEPRATDPGLVRLIAAHALPF